jgi:streptomycin 6-kinase
MVSSLLLGKALALGEPGRRWLRELDGILLSLADDWELELDEPLGGGSESYVVAAGEAAVLKVELPGDESFNARVAVLEAANGAGYVRLLRSDERRRALLIERLTPPDAEPSYNLIRAVLDEAWRVEIDMTLPTAVQKAQQLAQFIERTWRELNEPCPRALVDRALRCCASRAAAFVPGDAVVVHGDAHGGNLLLRGADGHVFVDPEPFFCEPAYDLAVALRTASDEEADVLPHAAHEWRFAERVSTGLLALQIGAEQLARALLS